MARTSSRCDRRVVDTRTAAFRPYERYGRELPGLTWLPLSLEAEAGRGCYLLRFAPGAQSLPHRHEDVEEFLVLEGRLVDSDGTVFAAGDFVSFAAGSRHYSTAPEGCLILAVLRQPNRPLSRS